MVTLSRMDLQVAGYIVGHMVTGLSHQICAFVSSISKTTWRRRSITHLRVKNITERLQFYACLNGGEFWDRDYKSLLILSSELLSNIGLSHCMTKRIGATFLLLHLLNHPLKSYWCYFDIKLCLLPGFKTEKPFTCFTMQKALAKRT